VPFLGLGFFSVFFEMVRQHLRHEVRIRSSRTQVGHLASAERAWSWASHESLGIQSVFMLVCFGSSSSDKRVPYLIMILLCAGPSWP
jgi:hypothetical protein